METPILFETFNEPSVTLNPPGLTTYRSTAQGSFTEAVAAPQPEIRGFKFSELSIPHRNLYYHDKPIDVTMDRTAYYFKKMNMTNSLKQGLLYGK